MTNKKEKSPYAPTLHRDGTVTYWSVYHQVLERVSHIADREYAAMSDRYRDRVVRHLGDDDDDDADD